MITTLTNVYNDILLRCGVGYTSMTSRARELFWRSVATLIKNREFSAADVAGVTTIDEIEVELIDFPFDLLSDITDHIFDLDATLLAGGPGNAILTYVDPHEFDMANLARKSMAYKTKLLEVLWTKKNQNIQVSFDTQNAQFSGGYLFVQRTVYGIPNAITVNDAETTAFAGYFSTAFATKAIELTVPALLQEVKG